MTEQGFFARPTLEVEDRTTSAEDFKAMLDQAFELERQQFIMLKQEIARLTAMVEAVTSERDEAKDRFNRVKEAGAIMNEAMKEAS